MDKLVLRDAFNSVDPVGIFFEPYEDFKGNVDEYDPEIDDLLKQSVNFSDVVEIKKVLTEIFHRWFNGMDISEKKISELATKLVELSNAK